MHTMLEIVTSNKSSFEWPEDFSWEQTAFVLELYLGSHVILNFSHDNLQMVWKWMTIIAKHLAQSIKKLLPWQQIHRKLLAWPHRGWGLVWKLLCVYTKLKLHFGKHMLILVQFRPLSWLWQQNLQCLESFRKWILALCWTTYYLTVPITCVTQTWSHRTQSLHYNKSS